MPDEKTGGQALAAYFEKLATQIKFLAEQVQELVQAAEVHRDCIDKLAQLITTPPRTKERVVN